jgi:hypothetical protein
MRSSYLASLASLALVASLPGCGAPKDPVQALLDDLVEAAEARDAGRVVERLAEAFQGSAGMTRAEARTTLQRYFTGYESIGITVYDVEVEGQHRVRFRVDFSGRPKQVGGLAGLLPSAAAYRFALEMASEGGRLVVSRGSWEPLPPSAE